MIETGNEESRRKADAYVVATVPEIRQAVRRAIKRRPTPNDKDRRDPWARPLGYDADKAVCRCCLRAFETVTDEHLRRVHRMSPEEYARRYPGAVRDPAPLGSDEMTTAEWKGWTDNSEGSE